MTKKRDAHSLEIKKKLSRILRGIWSLPIDFTGGLHSEQALIWFLKGARMAGLMKKREKDVRISYLDVWIGEIWSSIFINL